jgi:dienelactone hydrolase
MMQTKALGDPGRPGRFSVTTVPYAPRGLVYAEPPSAVRAAWPQLEPQFAAFRAEFAAFTDPAPCFETRRLDLSELSPVGHPELWSFDAREVPVSGFLCIPQGEGPFPVAVLAHGNALPLVNSAVGQRGLCESLASHGIVAATLDASFFNGMITGEIAARAVLHLEHVRQLQLWGGEAGHPLHGRVDTSRVLLCGHSRAGEAALHASVFNAQPGGYGYRVSVAVLAPTDGGYEPPGGPSRCPGDYLILHGSRDNESYVFAGYRAYDRTHAVDLSDPARPAAGCKALLWIHGANHAFFDGIMPQESEDTLTREEQQRITRAYVGAFAQAKLLGREGYFELLRDHRSGVACGWLPDVPYTSQFEHPERLFLQHFEEPGGDLVVSAPCRGRVRAEGVGARKVALEDGHTRHLFQSGHAVRLDWGSPRRFLPSGTRPQPLPAGSYLYFALRAGQSYERRNPPEADQDFRLVFTDGERTMERCASTLGRLLPPDRGLPSRPRAEGVEPKTVMQTLCIPFADIAAAGVDPARLRGIELRFDVTSSGTLYVDALRFTR